MEIIISDEIRAAAPAYKVIVLTADVHNPPTPDALWQELSECHRQKGTQDMAMVNKTPAIADTRGRLELTVPIAKPHTSRCRWDEIRISDHGEWWDVHRVALESAYGRTPYFEFYIDRLLPMLTTGVCGRYPLLKDLAGAWDSWIRRVLEIPQPAPVSASRFCPPSDIELPPYWQVRADRLGFIPGLSVLDLIFNLGPESVLYLDRL